MGVNQVNMKSSGLLQANTLIIIQMFYFLLFGVDTVTISTRLPGRSLQLQAAQLLGRFKWHDLTPPIKDLSCSYYYGQGK